MYIMSADLRQGVALTLHRTRLIKNYVITVRRWSDTATLRLLSGIDIDIGFTVWELTWGRSYPIHQGHLTITESLWRIQDLLRLQGSHGGVTVMASVRFQTHDGNHWGWCAQSILQIQHFQLTSTTTKTLTDLCDHLVAYGLITTLIVSV